MDEAGIIAIFAQHPLRLRRADVLQDIGDDCALVSVPTEQALAVSTDTLIAGVHFPLDFAAYDIGYKALAVNLSDLAAMAAIPAWFTCALTLPNANRKWLQDFAQGLLTLAKTFNVALIGGNVTKGDQLAITIQVHGFVPATQALRRNGAKDGDAIYISGTLGTAVAKNYYYCPYPRIALGVALRGKAHSAIDISDGLAKDLQHLLHASGLGATIDLHALPIAVELQQNYIQALTSGDDYELCFTAPAGLIVDNHIIHCIGYTEANLDLRLRQPDGSYLPLQNSGYQHF